MGREGRLPRALGSVDAHSAVPRRALLTAAVITLVSAVWAANRGNGLDELTSVVNVGALTAFVLLHASVIGWYTVREHSPDRLRHVVAPVLGIAVIVAVLVKASHPAQITGAVWLAVGLVIWAVQRRSIPAS
jgi:amino acid transporter